MQDRYVGDVGDFGKYGFLRKVCGCVAERRTLRLAVVWYFLRTEPAGHDGKHVSYLADTCKNRARFRDCNPNLWNQLKEIVEGEQRTVQAIEQRPILPGGTIFYRDPLDWPEGSSAPSKKHREFRVTFRNDWTQRALERTQCCDIVFLDPDNGIAPPSVKRHTVKAPKYVYISEEVFPYHGRGQTVVVYHHLNRIQNADAQLQERLDELHLSGAPKPLALRYHRGPARAFLVVPAKSHEEELRVRIDEFRHGPWQDHFALVRL